MSISLDSFKENLSNIVRPNRFLVYINPPKGLIESNLDSNVMKFYASSAVIPDRTFNEIEIKYYGMSFKVPGGESIQDLIITFINDEEWEIRDFFEQWANRINDRQDSSKEFMENLFEETYIEVHQLGYADNILAIYKFIHPFPKTVDQIDLGMDTTDSHQTFQVTFSYSYWERLEVEE